MNHVIRTVESFVNNFCGVLCFTEPNCVSYNMEVISGSPSITKCELNNSTHNEHPDDLKPWQNYIYQGTMVRAEYEDECTAATHTCDANAVCSNTHGSYNCTCKQGFAGDGHNCTENWIQMTPSTVCFGSRDDTYGSFRIPASGSIITFKLTYLSGSVNCYAPNPDVASNWGCKYPGLTHTMGTHITDSNRNRILPENEQYLMGGLGCGKTYYNLPWATPDSPELIFDHFSAPLSVTTDQEFQVWFIEDLFNCGYGDNSQERTCAEVYGLYV
ncbi:hypothetical protein ACROYT_G030257 [Oculina patagonica]